MKEWISDNNHLLKEWDYENNGLHPGKVGRGSDKKIWWKCEDNHRWQAPVHSRVIKKSGCPYCSGRLPTEDNNLLDKHPKLCLEWNCKNKKNPDRYTPKSSKKVWWQCSRGHEWESSISNRVTGNGCPYCSGLKVEEKDSFKSLYSDLFAEVHPSR